MNQMVYLKKKLYSLKIEKHIYIYTKFYKISIMFIKIKKDFY